MKKYHKDYVLETEVGESGKEQNKYHYTGKYYVSAYIRDKKKKIFIKNAVFDFLYLLLFILCGLLNNVGNRNFFIVVPYAFLFLPIVYLSIGTFSSLKMKEKMERVTYDGAIGRMYRSCMGILGISLYLCIADIICITMSFMDKKPLSVVHEVVFLFACILMFTCSVIQKKYLQNLKKKVMISEYDNEVP